MLWKHNFLGQLNKELGNLSNVIKMDCDTSSEKSKGWQKHIIAAFALYSHKEAAIFFPSVDTFDSQGQVERHKFSTAYCLFMAVKLFNDLFCTDLLKNATSIEGVHGGKMHLRNFPGNPVVNNIENHKIKKIRQFRTAIKSLFISPFRNSSLTNI